MSPLKNSLAALVWAWGFILFAGNGLSPLGAATQETVTNLDQPGTFNKYLTPSMVDRWVFQGQQGQLVLARVETREFDATLKLVQVIDDTEHLLLEVDDDGSNASLAFRLPADGEYKLLVHGFEFKGGGNYTVVLEQVRVFATAIDEVAAHSFDDRGTAWLYFQAAEESFVVVDLAGGSGARYDIRDSKGLPIDTWAGMVRLESQGEYYVRLDGARDRRFELRLHSVARRSLERDTSAEETMKPKSARVFDVAGKEASFGLLEIEVEGDLNTRFVLPARTKSATQTQSIQAKRGPRMIEVPSKGKYRRYAVVWGEDDTYQLQMVSDRGCAVKVRFVDPCIGLESVAMTQRNLPVGAMEFFRIPAEQGETLKLHCQSESFDSELRLYDKTGQLVARDDDGGGGFDAKIRYMPFATSELILGVSSRGNGGSGGYTLQTEAELPKQIVLDVKEVGKLATGETGFYSMDVQAGQKVLFHLQSQYEQAAITLLNANGIEVAQSSSQNHRDAVLVFEFTDSGRFAIVVRLAAEGTFQLRAIPAN